jgi:hypothetical protein
MKAIGCVTDHASNILKFSSYVKLNIAQKAIIESYISFDMLYNILIQ